MREWLRQQLSRRPWWMDLMLLFCAYMALIYVPRDLFLKPVAIDQEVWFGIRFYGWTAKLLAFPHWVVYAAGLVGSWRVARWMHPWAAVYALQMTIAVVVWNLLYKEGESRFVSAALGGVVFGWLSWALYRARVVFQPPTGSLPEG